MGQHEETKSQSAVQKWRCTKGCIKLRIKLDRLIVEEPIVLKEPISPSLAAIPYIDEHRCMFLQAEVVPKGHINLQSNPKHPIRQVIPTSLVQEGILPLLIRSLPSRKVIHR